MSIRHTVTACFTALIVLAGCGEQSTDRSASPSSPEAPADEPSLADTRPTIVFFGNSLSAGYGLEKPEEQAFPALIQQRLDSLGLAYQVLNAGISGETTTGGLARVDWILRQPVDIFVLELGGNDGLRGIPPAETRANLQAIIDRVREKYPAAKIILAGMEAPPNMGPDFTSAFRKIYPDLARKNDVALIPFLLEGVGGEPALNQPDGIHPNPEGAKIVADNVWEALRPLVS